MPDWMIELLLPRTDAGVTVQWLIMAPFWLIVVAAARRLPRDVQLLIWGLATMNLAWFLVRMAH